MSDRITVKLKCPNCGLEFEDNYAGVLNLSGAGFRADFKPGFVSDSSISELLLYQCSHCGFTERSIIDRFAKPASQLQVKFINEALPEIRIGTEKLDCNSHSKFENYAMFLEFSGGRLFDIGKAYLRASWVNDSDLCREKALEYFENAVSDKDSIGSAEAPLAAYLGGEMARKLEKYLAAERLYHVANKLSGKSPELAIRTYSFLLEMSQRQSTAPTDEPIWNFSEGLILDPLDYYHTKILTTIAVYYRYTQQDDAVALYNRAFDLCKPAMERTVSQKHPDLDINHNGSYLTMQLARKSVMPDSSGFWVDSSLLMMGTQSLKELKKLKSGIQDSELIEKVEVESRTYSGIIETLEKDLKKQSKREGKSEGKDAYKGVNQQRIEKVWNTVIFIFLGLATSMAGSTITYYGLELLKIYKYWILITAGTISAWLIWAVGQRILRSIFGLLSKLVKRDLNENPIVQIVTGLLVFLGGLAASILLGGWPVLPSILIATGILGLLNLLVRRMKS